MVKSVLKIYLLFLSIISYGQSNQEIESAEFIVEKDKDLELPKRERIFEYVKPIPTLATFDSLTFISKEVPFEIGSYHPNLRVEPLQRAVKEKNYDHLINIGFGTYNTPGISYEYRTNHSLGSNFGINIDLKKHQKGPVKGNYSGESNSDVRLWHRINLGKGILSSSLDYGYSKFYNFGGLNQIINTNRVIDTADHYLRRQHQFNLYFEYLVNTKSKKQIHIMPQWHYTGQQGLSKTDNISSYYSGGEENDFVLNVNLDVIKNRFWDFDFDFFMSFAQFNNHRFKNNQRFWTYVIPKIDLIFDDWSVSGGAKIGFYDDAAKGGSGFLLPDLMVSYKFGNNLSVYGEVKGDIKRNDYKSVISQNRHVSDSISLNTSIEQIGLKLGALGILLPRMTYDINFSIKSINDQMYFRNNKNDPSYFDVVYDLGSSSRFDFESYFNYHVTNQLSWFTLIKYNSIKTSTIQKPWHIPSVSFQIGSKFKLMNDRLVISPFFINFFDIKATSQDEQIISLPSVMDFGMDINTVFRENIGVFLKIRNLLGKENQIYNLYSSREFDIYGGISVRF